MHELIEFRNIELTFGIKATLPLPCLSVFSAIGCWRNKDECISFSERKIEWILRAQVGNLRGFLIDLDNL